MFNEVINDKDRNIIFFDIFDTIVSRKMEPEYLKKVWSVNIVKTFELSLTSVELYGLRNKIESELGLENHNMGNDYEFTYVSMIKSIYEELNEDIDYNLFLKKCVDTEIELESNVLYVNDDIIDLIRNLKKKNKKIYAVSDMYLSKDMLLEIFKRLNIFNMIDDIFVSCEYLKNKKSGELYKIVLKKLNVDASQVYMIGDNSLGDYEIPNSIGIKSVLLDRKEKYKFYSDFKLEYDEKNITNNFKKLKFKDTSQFENIIFSLYKFIERIYYRLIKENQTEVFFLSREGEYLKKLFDYYVKKQGNVKIKSHYLYVSRKSTYLPSLTKLSEEKFNALLNQYSYITINEFLKSLNFNENDIKCIYEEENKNRKNCDFNKKISDFRNSKEFKSLINNSVFKKIYESNRLEQKQNFIEYINDKTDSHEFYVVDIGWNGSIQNNIQNILGTNYIIKGLYFGLQRKDLKESIEKYGLVFTNSPCYNVEYNLYAENRTIYEIILGASHGSANKYVIKNNKVEVELFKKKEEEKIYNCLIHPIQDVMFDKFIQICNVLINKYFDNKKVDKLINQIHFDMIFNPSKLQYTFFNKIYHYENFGVFEFTEFNSKNKITFKRYIKENFKFFLRYKTYFYDTYWPMLKLHNYKLYLQMLIYRSIKKYQLKKDNVI